MNLLVPTDSGKKYQVRNYCDNVRIIYETNYMIAKLCAGFIGWRGSRPSLASPSSGHDRLTVSRYRNTHSCHRRDNTSSTTSILQSAELNLGLRWEQTLVKINRLFSISRLAISRPFSELLLD